MISQRLVELLVNSFWQIILPGLKITIPLTLVSFAISLVIALFTAVVQVANIKGLKQLARLYVWVIRGTPLLVQLYVIFYGLPGIGITLDALPSAIVVFAFNTGAYASETIRAAIESVPDGQLEAGYCVGMSYTQTMVRIILPQALRTAFPPLSNSLAANITVMEMFMSAQRIAARTYEPFALYCEVGLVYLVFCTVLTRLQRVWEAKLKLG